jgi:hypothetical protein
MANPTFERPGGNPRVPRVRRAVPESPTDQLAVNSYSHRINASAAQPRKPSQAIITDIIDAARNPVATLRLDGTDVGWALFDGCNPNRR